MNEEKNKGQKKFLGFLGMRVIKTVVAVLITFLYGYFLDTNPIYASFAAVVTTKDSQESTQNYGIGRILGTVIGGIFGLFTIIALLNIGMEVFSLQYYIIIALMLIPVIYISVYFFGPQSTITSCIVFLSITISHSGETLPIEFALMRTATTAFGVVVSIAVNRYL